jgi:hypoxanthine phosphoribosyltransferase
MTRLPSTDADLWVSWDEYHRTVERLCMLLYESGWRFDQVLCLARGGLRVGDVVSRIFDLPLAILATSSYRAAGGTLQGRLDIAEHITSTRGAIAGKLLLVDDLVDSGVTLDEVARHLSEQFPEITEVRTAVLWWKASSRIKPDFYVEHLPTNPWIHQPFEDYDTLRPEQLAAWMKRGTTRP